MTDRPGSFDVPGRVAEWRDWSSRISDFSAICVFVGGVLVGLGVVLIFAIFLLGGLWGALLFAMDFIRRAAMTAQPDTGNFLAFAC